MIIKHNIPAKNAYRNLHNNQKNIQGSLEKLASGYQINRAGDNAAGLAVSEKMRCKITGLTAGTSNAEDGVNLVRTAEGAIQEIHDMLNRLVELSVQSANGTYDDEVDRAALQQEVDAIVSEVDRIVESTNFNGIYLLNREEIQQIVTDVIEYCETVDTGRTEMVDSGTTEWGGTGEYTYSPYNTYSTQYTALSVGDTTGTNLSTSRYTSDGITVESWAQSIPNDVTLPYTLELIYTTYDDVNSTVDNIILGEESVLLEITQDNQGNYIITGTKNNGTTVDYTTKAYQTALDLATGSPGLEYVSDFASNGITSTEMQYIMADLIGGSLGPDATDLYALGTMSYDWASEVRSTSPTVTYETSGNISSTIYTYTYDSDSGDTVTYSYSYDKNNNTGTTSYSYEYAFTGPNFSDGGDYSYTSSSSVPSSVWGQCFYAEDVYSLGTSYYESLYGNGMVVTGTSSSSNRVIGVEINAYVGDSVVNSSQTPSGFSSDYWTANTDLFQNASAESFLGATSVAEPYYRTQIGIPDPFLNGADISSMTTAELSQYIITVSQMQTDDLMFDENDVLVEKNYLVVYNPFDNSLLNYFSEENITVITVDKDSDPTNDYLAVDELCQAISADTDLSINNNSFADRKPTSYDDLHIDDNYTASGTDRFIIEVGQYSQTKIDYTTTEIMGDIPVMEEVKVYEDVYTYEYIYEEKENPIILQVGDQNQDFDRVFVHIDNMRDEVETLMTVDTSNQDSAAQSIDVIKSVINEASSNRSRLGAYENRLKHTINVNRINIENLQDAESRIRDTDFAEEMMKYTANQILIESSQSMLAQANQLPQGVLSLLG